MANLAFDLTDSVMLYATYSEGFKSGGFTQRVFPPIVPPFTAPPGTPDIDLIPTYEPEFVEVLEAGVKLDLLDGRAAFERRHLPDQITKSCKFRFQQRGTGHTEYW